MMYVTNNYLETIELGRKIGSLIRGKHVVILLVGDLAAGKTTLTKGIAKGLGINSIIKSPTFTIMRNYEENDSILYHLDLYRLSEIGNDFDLEEYVNDPNGVVVIEWPFQVNDLLPSEYIKINITGIEDSRTFEVIETKEYIGVLSKL